MSISPPQPSRRGFAALLVAVAAGLGPQAALALGGGPPNDGQRDAQPITGLPAAVRGTTVDADDDRKESELCGDVGASVWYRIPVTRTGRMVLRLHALGRFAGTMAVRIQTRGQTAHGGCAATEQGGHAHEVVDAERGQELLVLVATNAYATDGTFELRVARAEPPARPYGQALPPAGVRATVGAPEDPDDAWTVELAEGASYRVSLAAGAGGCVSVRLYRVSRPRAPFSERKPARVLPCGGSLTYAPGYRQGGRYSVLVAPRGARDVPQRYRLVVAPASPDDVAPGLAIANGERLAGTLDGRRGDVLDLYRFAVARTSDVAIVLRTGRAFDLTLLDEHGQRLRCECGARSDGSIREELPRGLYYAAVRPRGQARGSYSVFRLVRAITTTSLEASSNGVVPAGRAVRLAAGVRPAPSGGTVFFLLWRLDPVGGWRFAGRLRAELVDGRAGVAWIPPVGRYRVQARYRGTLSSAPSRTAPVSLRVVPEVLAPA